MAKHQIDSVSELEAILLAELRKARGCEGVAQVTIIAKSASEWVCGPLRPGTADPSICRSELSKIATRLNNLYEIKFSPR
jgi:hypothetical protein